MKIDCSKFLTVDALTGFSCNTVKLDDEAFTW